MTFLKKAARRNLWFREMIQCGEFEPAGARKQCFRNVEQGWDMDFVLALRIMVSKERAEELARIFDVPVEMILSERGDL